MDTKEGKPRRSSLFWPVILIALGILLLLQNIGALEGEFWDNLLQFWPVLLIAVGLDSIWRRKGLAGATLWIGLGVTFTLINFDILALSIWQVILSLWPLFLIAIGFDILIGRRSKLLGAFGILLMTALLAGSLWLLSTGVEITYGGESRQIRQDLDGATQARVKILPGVGILRLKDLRESLALVMGTIPSEYSVQVTQSFSMIDDRAVYSLNSISGNFSFPGAGQLFIWDLGLTPSIPIDLEVEMGLGETNLELTNLDLNSLSLDLGVGQSDLILPSRGQLDGTIDAAIGQVIIWVPSEIGLRVQKDTALVIVQFPEDYHQEKGIYTSPNYTSADHHVDLRIDMAIGRIVIRKMD